MLVADILRRNATYFGDDDAVVDPAVRTWSWVQLEDRANRLANALLGLGLTKGDRVAVLSPNSPDYVTFFFACSLSGILGAPLNIRLTPPELISYLNYVRPRALLAGDGQEDAAKVVAAEVPSIEHVVGMVSPTFDDFLAAAPPTGPSADVDGTTPYMLGATSGTTGVAKAVVQTNATAIAGIAAWQAELPIAERQTSLQTIPQFFNPGGPAGIHPVLAKGGRTVITPGFEPGLFLRLVAEYRVTHSILVPTMIRMVLDHPDAAHADLSSLRAIICGASPVSRELLLAAREVLGDVFFPFYGMAETYSCGLVLRPENQRPEGDDDDVRRLGSAGKPHVNLSVRVVDDDGRPVPHDGQSVGEVLVAGDTVAVGYFEMPEETAQAFRDGWMHTGDLATIDAGGFITIVDRKKDIIISGGINVASREVEEVLLRHPAIGQAAVIGVPHERWGEAIHAVVVAAPGVTVDTDAVLAHCAAALADYKRPRSIEVVSELPISGTGKVLKRVLREPYWPAREAT